MRKQAGGATGAGGSGAIAIDQGAQLGNWLLAGIVIFTFAMFIILIIRAVINARRATAYAQEATYA